MGRIETLPVAKINGEIKVIKVLPLIISCDDRICDGLYYGRSLKMLEKFIKKPALLENAPETVIEDIY
jgi:pyruvate/2-oxoglutarate dehydrogenase complex dihydrolipoamide acyltransferase (E2) component